MTHLTSTMKLTPALYRATKQNVRVEDITGAVSGGRVTWDESRAIGTNFSASLNTTGVVAPYADYLAPYLTVEYADGTTISRQLGLFLATVPKRDADRQRTADTIEGADLTALLAFDIVSGGYHVSSSANVVAAVETLLGTAGITRHAIQASASTLATARSWKPGDSKLIIANQLLNAIGYYPLYALRDGRITSKPWQLLKNTEASVTYAAPPRQDVRVVRSITLDRSDDLLCNKAVVIKDGGTGAAITASYTNNNPASPTSTASLGLTLATTIRDSTIETQAVADALAKKVVEEGSSVLYRMKLLTTPDPDRSPHEVYAIDIQNDAGAQIASGRWWCSGWSIGFTPDDGPMEHTLNKLITWEKAS